MARRKTVALVAIVAVLAGIIGGMYIESSLSSGLAYNHGGGYSTSIAQENGTLSPSINITAVESEVLPAQGITLPAKWGDAAKKLINSGALNETTLEQAVNQNGQLMTAEELKILNGTSTDNIMLNSTDTSFALYVLWAIGINNNNSIINSGPLMKYGGNPDQFASTGGYASLGVLHLGGMNLISLTPSEQAIVNYTAANTYRPCCNNPTSMPDCNHGAAALGLIELMASQGNNMTATFNAVRAFNSFQYPQQYIDIGVYLESKGVSFDSVPAAAVLSFNASSASGISNLKNYLKTDGLTPSPNGGGSSCSA